MPIANVHESSHIDTTLLVAYPDALPVAYTIRPPQTFQPAIRYGVHVSRDHNLLGPAST